jgi:hypothetical protein
MTEKSTLQLSAGIKMLEFHRSIAYRKDAPSLLHSTNLGSPLVLIAQKIEYVLKLVHGTLIAHMLLAEGQPKEPSFEHVNLCTW